MFGGFCHTLLDHHRGLYQKVRNLRTRIKLSSWSFVTRMLDGNALCSDEAVREDVCPCDLGRFTVGNNVLRVTLTQTDHRHLPAQPKTQRYWEITSLFSNVSIANTVIVTTGDILRRFNVQLMWVISNQAASRCQATKLANQSSTVTCRLNEQPSRFLLWCNLISCSGHGSSTSQKAQCGRHGSGRTQLRRAGPNMVNTGDRSLWWSKSEETTTKLHGLQMAHELCWVQLSLGLSQT